MEVVGIGTIRYHFLNKTTFTESKFDRYYGPKYVDLVQTMMFAGIIWAILVLFSRYYSKSCVITEFTRNDMVDYHLGTMPWAEGRHQASNNRNGNQPMEPKLKGGTPGFKHVVLTYKKGMKQSDWKENLQALSGIAASSTKYDGAHLARAIRAMAFQYNPKTLGWWENASTLLKKKYKQACKKWVKVKEEVNENNKSAYKLILTHYDPSTKMKLESNADFQLIKDDQDGMAFLKLLHLIYFQHNGTKQNIM